MSPDRRGDGDGWARGGAGVTPGAVRSGNVSKSVAKAPRGRIAVKKSAEYQRSSSRVPARFGPLQQIWTNGAATGPAGSTGTPIGQADPAGTDRRGPSSGWRGPDPACAMRARRNIIHPTSRHASSARHNPPALDPREPTWRNASPGDITKTTPPGVGTGERRARLRAAPRLPGERNSGGRRADGRHDRTRPRTAVSGEKGSPNQR